MSTVSLPNATNLEGRYVHISQVSSGLKPDLRCPYCRGVLIARKGQQMAHHFAHATETCFDVTDRDFSELDVPLYDRFNLYINASAWHELQKFHDSDGRYGQRRLLVQHAPSLIREGFGHYRNYELTNEGKIPFGRATLSAFADYQNWKVYDRHKILSDPVEASYFGIPRFVGFGEQRQQRGYMIEPAKEQTVKNLIDLNIYRAQVQRLYTFDLYLLKIAADDKTLYKIGVSSDVERRIKDIERDLKPHMLVKKITIDRLAENRGAVERYAHHRYRDHLYSFANFREYFVFDRQQISNVRRDFTRLGNCDYEVDGKWYRRDPHADEDEMEYGAYTNEGLIGQILAGELSWAEQRVKKDQHAIATSKGTKQGMKRAKERGSQIGRPIDTGNTFIARHPKIIEALQAGKGIKQIARELKVSKNTIRKVRDAL